MTTREQMLEQSRPEALRRIQNSLVLEAIVKAEGIEASDEDIDAEVTKMADMYKMDAEKLKANMGEEDKKQMGADIAIQKVVDLLVESAVEK